MATQFAYNGNLSTNELFGSIYNMIISQQVFSDNIKGTYDSLASKFKTDGGLYADTKLFYSTDVLKSHKFPATRNARIADATNLLALELPDDPECQSVTIDQFRQIRLSIESWLTKRAWSTEGAFSQFQSVMMGWIGATKKIYESTLINTYVGTTVSNANKAVVEVGIAAATQGLTGEEKNRVEAQTIAQKLADLMIEMKDVSRDFTDYKNLRSYDESDLMVIWNSDYVNKLTNLDLPTIFHNDKLFTDFSNVLPSRYFGEVVTSATTKSDNDGTYRSLIETDYTTATSVGAMNKSNTTHVFPGDLIPSGTAKYDEDTNTIASGILANEAYQNKEEKDIICKIVYKNAIPFMSAFETSTSFYNGRVLVENHYLTWGYSAPCYLFDKPFITVEAD